MHPLVSFFSRSHFLTVRMAFHIHLYPISSVLTRVYFQSSSSPKCYYPAILVHILTALQELITPYKGNACPHCSYLFLPSFVVENEPLSATFSVVQVPDRNLFFLHFQPITKTLFVFPFSPLCTFLLPTVRRVMSIQNNISYLLS